MQERDSSPGFAAGHLLIAVLIAALVAGGVYAWLRHNAVQTASTAELSFDARAARRIDPGIAASNQPAVAVAQSILSDAVVAGLSKQAYLASSSMAGRVGEFRSRLELTQSSSKMLRVGFEDVDPAKAAGTANAVAKTLVAWSPADNGPPVAGTEPQPAVSSPPATPSQPVAPGAATQQKPEAQEGGQPAHPLSDQLSALAGQLSATDRKLEGARPERGRTRTERGARERNEEAYLESRQQGILKTSVREAQKKVEDLRSQYADDPAVPDARDRLGEIQQDLSSILPGGHGSRYNGAGIDASQLRRERAELARVIGVVERERRSIAQEEAAHPPPAANAAGQPASASSTPAATSSSTSAVSETNLPAPGSSPSAAPPPAPAAASVEGSGQSPLHVVRLAGTTPARPLWWPGALAGCVCGLIYLGLAGRGSRVEDELEDTESVPQRAQRMITPEGPVAAANLRDNRPAAYADEEIRPRRAAFTYEPAPGESGAAEAEAAAAGEPAEAPAEPVQSAGAAANQGTAPEAPVVTMGDPWVEDVKRALSQTRLGKDLEEPAQQGRGTATDDKAQENPPGSGYPNRRAG